MRTPIFAAVLGLSLVGCLVGDEGMPGSTGGGDPNGSGSGSNTGTGTGTGSGSGSGSNPMPSLDVAMDKPTVATELGKDATVTLTLTGAGSFAGDVTVATSLVDATGAPVTGGITVTGQSTVTLAANATATAAYTVKVPSDATGVDLNAKLNFDVKSSVGEKQVASAITIAAVYSMTYAAGLGSNVTTHPGRLLNVTVKQGAKIQLHNADTSVHITHADGAFPHETTGATGGLSNNTYVIDTAKDAPGATGNIGCHSHGSATYAKFTVD